MPVLPSEKKLFSESEEKVVIKTVQKYIKNFPNKRTKIMKRYNKSELNEKIEQNITKSLRKIYIPKPRTTSPDVLTSILLENLFEHEKKERNKIQKYYNDQKQTEMFIGNLLELYILKQGLKSGWAFTATIVDKVDFVKEKRNSWITLQIKNSDNTENSSSSSVRDGTTILKWVRRNSKKGTYYWNEFPDTVLRKKLSETKFRAFIRSYYKKYKSR